MTEFLPSELVINPDGSVYHLNVRPEEIAHKLIIVGDQDRVEVVSSYFDEIKFKKHHREFTCHTGVYKGKSISVLSTGIGTDNIDIVMNELDALVNIDFTTRTEKSDKTILEIVRLGTCGILQDEIPVDSFILSTHALGIDNVGHFYQRDIAPETQELLNEIEAEIKLPEFIKPYLTPASTVLNSRLESDSVEKGITVTSSGFYGPQGRKLRLPIKAEQMLDSFHDFSHPKVRFSNLEMECSALFTLSKEMEHEATAICLGLANRRKKRFSTNYDNKIKELIQYVLERI